MQQVFPKLLTQHRICRTEKAKFTLGVRQEADVSISVSVTSAKWFSLWSQAKKTTERDPNQVSPQRCAERLPVGTDYPNSLTACPLEELLFLRRSEAFRRAPPPPIKWWKKQNRFLLPAVRQSVIPRGVTFRDCGIAVRKRDIRLVGLLPHLEMGTLAAVQIIWSMIDGPLEAA